MKRTWVAFTCSRCQEPTLRKLHSPAPDELTQLVCLMCALNERAPNLLRFCIVLIIGALVALALLVFYLDPPSVNPPPPGADPCAGIITLHSETGVRPPCPPQPISEP